MKTFGIKKIRRWSKAKRIRYYAARVAAGLALWEDKQVNTQGQKSGGQNRMVCYGCDIESGCTTSVHILPRGWVKIGREFQCPGCTARYGVAK